eukprot:14157678-Heterocapsa_arctica.AAC.1
MREHTLPKIVGRARNGTAPTSGKSNRETIYGLHGPIPTPLKNPTGRGLAVRLIRDPKGPGL